MVTVGIQVIQVQEAVLKYKYTEGIVFLEDSTHGRKTLIAVAKHLYEVVIGFNNVSREYVLESGGNWT